MKLTLNALALSLCSAIAAMSAAPAYSQSNENSGPVSGAVFTTNKDCAAVNDNIYDLKDSVFVDGGPARTGTAGLLSNTSYYVQVTDPSGQVVLGSSVNNTSISKTPITTDALGDVLGCFQLNQIVSLADGTLGFADTPNNGGEYKVWISTTADFTNRYTKTDNFKVKGSTRPEDPTGTIDIVKFYDANANGIKDDKESYMPDWQVDLMDFGIQYTPARYTGLAVVGGQSYTAREYQPIQTNWYATTPSPKSTTPTYLNQLTVPLTASAPTAQVVFGNVCTGAGGGLTLGYWSNKNGVTAINKFGATTVFSALTALNLVNPDGTPFNPSQHDQFKNWLLSGNAINMANMLSIQLATMYLNVMVNGVSGAALIYAPGVPGANSAGFASVSTVIAAADKSLGDYNLTTAGSPERATQEMIKNALDMANNNKTFVKSVPCTFTFAPIVTPVTSTVTQ